MNLRMDELLPERGRPVHLPQRNINGRSAIHFVTVCTKDRRPLLATPLAHAALVAVWRESTWFLVGRYIVMPDHVHLFCSPANFPPESLARWLAFWKSRVASRWPGGATDGKLWQRDFWDTQLRNGESYTAKWAYVRANPGRAGLVDEGEVWPYQGELNTLFWLE